MPRNESYYTNWVLQHYNEMCYRLLRGTTLLKKVLEDATLALNILVKLAAQSQVQVAILGHSYGGNTVIFQAALDERIAIACSSGAVCTYATKFAHDTGIEMAEVIPGFTQHFDIDEVLSCIAPRCLLIVSATDDQFSQDAAAVHAKLGKVYGHLKADENLSFKEFAGPHPLTSHRFQFIVNWLENQF